MNLQSLTVGPFEAECYLVTADIVLVIDPGGDATVIEQVLQNAHAPVGAYLLTHGHVDHLSALLALLTRHPAPVYLHAADAVWAFTAANQLPPFYPPPPARPANLVPVHDGQVLHLGEFTVTVIATPGHSPGSVCYHFPDDATLFSGDTLFDGSVGRTDLPGGDGRQLQASLRRLAALPPATAIHPGHGPTTTLAEQIRINPFLKALPDP